MVDVPRSPSDDGLRQRIAQAVADHYAPSDHDKALYYAEFGTLSDEDNEPSESDYAVADAVLRALAVSSTQTEPTAEEIDVDALVATIHRLNAEQLDRLWTNIPLASGDPYVAARSVSEEKGK